MLPVTRLILDQKSKKGLTWESIAQQIGRSEAWTVSAAFGQAVLSEEEAAALARALDLEPESLQELQAIPYRGAIAEIPPRDPVLYRFYEILLVYGPAMKELIHEKFGDGIMSAIDFEWKIEKVPDPKGDRVRVELNGKFLPYRKW